MNVGDVVQFNENHEWCGCLGIIEEKKMIHNEKLSGEGLNDARYMIGVPIPQEGTAYIYVLESEETIEYVGKTLFVPKEDEKGEE